MTLTELRAALLECSKQHIAIVGRTGSGKTYAAKGIVEGLLDAGRRVIVLDPTGAWWGLRRHADYGRVIIIGGDHGDVPLSKDMGTDLGGYLVHKDLSAIVDLSGLLIGERHKFMENFASALHAANRKPLHLVIDEADEFAPQNPMPEARRMLHQVDRIVRRGRVKGFRVMLVTQRPAVLHKNVLTQANTLIAMRLTAPQDRKAIEAWVEGQADTAKAKAVLSSLAGLKVGQGWVWAPELDILERAQFPEIKSFDSSAAPDDDAAADLATVLRGADMESVALDLERNLWAGKKIDEAVVAATLLDADETNKTRAELRVQAQKIAALEDQLAARQTSMKSAMNDLSSLRDGIGKVIMQMLLIVERGTLMTPQQHADAPLADKVFKAMYRPNVSFRESAKPGTALQFPEPSVAVQIPTLGKAERAIMSVLAIYRHIGSRSKAAIAIHAGYAVSGGGFNNALSSLRAKGLIEGADPISLTDKGRRAGPFPEPLFGKALAGYWQAQLPKAEREILRVVCASRDTDYDKATLARHTGYQVTGGGFNNALSKLRTLGLISGGHMIRASEEFFQ